GGGRGAGQTVAARKGAPPWHRAVLEPAEGVRDPGPSLIGRHTRRQYNNTIRDLLGVDTRPADAFPADGGGGAGFDNNAATLFVPSILMEKYLDATANVLGKADVARYVVSRPSLSVSKSDAARRCIANFVRRAYRRPVTGEDVDRWLPLFLRADAEGQGFESALQLALRFWYPRAFSICSRLTGPVSRGLIESLNTNLRAGS